MDFLFLCGTTHLKEHKKGPGPSEEEDAHFSWTWTWKIMPRCIKAIEDNDCGEPICIGNCLLFEMTELILTGPTQGEPTI